LDFLPIKFISDDIEKIAANYVIEQYCFATSPHMKESRHPIRASDFGSKMSLLFPKQNFQSGDSNLEGKEEALN